MMVGLFLSILFLVVPLSNGIYFPPALCGCAATELCFVEHLGDDEVSLLHLEISKKNS